MASRADMPMVKLAEDWSARIAKIARNLTDFNDSDEARRVSSRLRDPDRAYTGRTLEEATRAAEALQGLWQDYLTLSSVVDKAVALSRRSTFLSSKDDEVVALLEGPSVSLPTISIPVNRRDLLDDPETRAVATPGDVLASMKAAFAVARDTMARIASAEDLLAPRLATIRARADDLRRWRARTKVDLGGDPLDGLDLADADRDPLAALEALDTAETSLARREAERIKADAALARLGSGFRAADQALASIRETYGKAAQGFDATGAVKAGPRALPPGASDEVLGLSAWLDTLRRTAADGTLGSATIGLGKWNEATGAARAKADAALAAARAPLDELADLRGWFRALRAKGAVLRSDEAARIEAETKAELARVPVRLVEARRLVAAYEKALATAKPAANGETA